MFATSFNPVTIFFVKDLVICLDLCPGLDLAAPATGATLLFLKLSFLLLEFLYSLDSLPLQRNGGILLV